MIIIEQSAALDWATENPEQVIERAGRTAYKSEDRITSNSAKQFIEMVMKRGHLSVIEHASASIRFICDRGITHEIVRHRLASYTQESTRYCNYSKDKHRNQLTVIKPPDLDWKSATGTGCMWQDLCLAAEATYLNMLKSNVTPQIARSVLPNCLKTEIVMTCNFREWLHFLNLRCAEAAHPQMRELALMAKNILTNISPTIFGGD